MKKYLSILKRIVQDTPPRLFVVCVLFSLFLSGCISMSPVMNGTQEDMFIGTSVKKINIPTWIQLFGLMTFISCLTASTVSTILVMEKERKEDVKGGVDLPIKKLILLDLVILLAVGAFTSVLGFFAFTMEILDVSWAFTLLLGFQIAFLLLASLSSLEQLGEDLD